MMVMGKQCCPGRNEAAVDHAIPLAGSSCSYGDAVREEVSCPVSTILVSDLCLISVNTPTTKIKR